MINNNDTVKSSPSGGIKSSFGAWCALIRLPNLFTLPGDVILGFIIAESLLGKNDLMLGYSFCKGEFLSYSIFYACAAVLSVYLFGLITNDIADFAEDLRERPDRPLPSGRISKRAAWFAASVMLAAGIIFALFANSAVLSVTVLLYLLSAGYNFIFKKNPQVGAMVLGCCRMLTVYTGFLAADIQCVGLPPMLYLVVFIWLLYILRISLIASYETAIERRIKRNYILLVIPLFWLVAAIHISGALQVIVLVRKLPPGIYPGLGALLVLMITVVHNFLILNKDTLTPEEMQKSVGALIRGIIFLQASGCAFMGYPYIALALFLLWIPAWFSGKYFQGS